MLVGNLCYVDAADFSTSPQLLEVDKQVLPIPMASALSLVIKAKTLLAISACLRMDVHI